MREPFSFDESFPTLHVTEQELQRLGWHFYPIPKEHAEGPVTAPLLARLRALIKKRGFAKIAGKVILTFSGFAQDPREIFAIPVARSYWRQLERELPELPALLGVLPEMGYNGPGLHLALLGEVDEMIDRPQVGAYDLHVQGAEQLVAAAVRRIKRVCAKHGVTPVVTQKLIGQFLEGTTSRA